MERHGVCSNLQGLVLGITVKSQVAVDETIQKLLNDLGLENTEQLKKQGYKACVETTENGEITIGARLNGSIVAEYKLTTIVAKDEGITIDFAIEKTI